MIYETYDTYSSQREDIQNTVGWDTDQLLENKFDSIVTVNQEIKELQTNIFQKISLKLWLIKLLIEGKIYEDQFNDMLEKYDYNVIELVNRRKVVLHATNEELVSLNKELNESKIFLAEIEKKKEISDISEEEYLVKKRKFEWEITHYQNKISIRTEVQYFLENPYNTISSKKYNEMKQEAKRCLEKIDNLNTSYNISFNTIKKTKISMENLVEHLRGYNLTQHKQLDSLDSDEADDEIKQPISSAIPDKHDARDDPLELLNSLDFDEVDVEIKQPISLAIPDKHDARDDPIEQEPKTEEIIEENKLFRVECPYSDVNGKKCKVIAFSTKKAEAYQKLKEHVIENHPEKIKEFTDIIKKSTS